MPLLPFIESDPPEYVRMLVGWQMIHPNDKDLAKECFVMDYLANIVRVHERPNDELLQLPASAIKALLDGPSFMELHKGVEEKKRQGVTAGALLLFLYTCASLKRPLSFNKAADVLCCADDKRPVSYTHLTLPTKRIV